MVQSRPVTIYRILSWPVAEYSYGDIIVALGRSKDDDDHDRDVDRFSAWLVAEGSEV